MECVDVWGVWDVKCEGVTLCAITGVAKRQVTCSGHHWWWSNVPFVREKLNSRPAAVRLCAPPTWYQYHMQITWPRKLRSHDSHDPIMQVTCVTHAWHKMLTSHIASYPGLLAPAFVACSTSVGEALVKLSYVVWCTWTYGLQQHSLCCWCVWAPL